MTWAIFVHLAVPSSRDSTSARVRVPAFRLASSADRTALPAEMFDPARLLTARVDSRARICVRQNYYSVPARYAGRRLAVRLSARTVDALDGQRVIAEHERSAGKYAEVLVLDHYLDVLKYRPGALPGATALAQARAAGRSRPATSGTGKPSAASSVTPPALER